jgi:hypothetical protein
MVRENPSRILHSVFVLLSVLFAARLCPSTPSAILYLSASMASTGSVNWAGMVVDIFAFLYHDKRRN